VSGHLDNNDSRRRSRRLPLLSLQRLLAVPGNGVHGSTSNKVIRMPLPAAEGLRSLPLIFQEEFA